ncbi:hypothetical protein HC766_06950 [Candidatus Gracilibacteria bacterium]|nr:hypothetical protein [Candidatus Gracilibacteria bacterium]
MKDNISTQPRNYQIPPYKPLSMSKQAQYLSKQETRQQKYQKLRDSHNYKRKTTQKGIGAQPTSR